ncbi:MAG TPA: hypothetical protein VGO69_03790 [Pyrinomonadaceae bacterium]|jgi:hypothetical protein|nr:hypothetical protein [Pyrinomonadaceae bacterium]
MSKRIRLQVITLAAALSLAVVVFIGPAVAQKQAPAVTSTNTKSAAVMAATETVLKETSEVRQLPILRPVKSGAQTRAEIERMLIKNMDEDTTPEELHASELTLKKLGLIPASMQLRPFIISLLTEQVAGYYDPKAQQFYLADWIDLDGQKPVMAHELVHALQDQHFNLRRFDKWPKGDADAELAAHALIEGDATLAMQYYIMRNPLRALAFIRSLEASGAGSSDLIDKAPRALRESLLFPYQQGMEFVSQLYKRNDSWKLVSQAFTDLPQSTEQILHSDKYFAHEAPVKIELANVSGTLGANWKRIDYDVNGEWSYYLILDEFLKSKSESRVATTGWGGDRYAVYNEPKTGAVCITQLSAWDTETDAREFFDAYVKRTELRYKDATPLDSAPPELSSKGSEVRAWQTNEGAVYILRNADRVFIVEGLPAGVNINKLMNATVGKELAGK